MAGCSNQRRVVGSKGDQYTVNKDVQKVDNDSSEKEYEPYTITLNLERSGAGQNMEETFTSAPKRVVADGDQMVDFFLDLGLEDHIAGFTRGSCLDTVNDFPARDKLNKILPDGQNLNKASKEQILSLNADFMIGWDSLFSDDNFSVDWCLKNNIIPYFPYSCSDKATMEDVYKDYDTLGHIFGVSDVAEQRVQAMKNTIEEVKNTLGEDVYKIGVTRRLEPLERIRELSSASVPFQFDVHALIFSEEAFALETELHNQLSEYKVNKVNNRKEYFKVPFEKIKALLDKHEELTIELNENAEAFEYRQTLLKG